MSVVADNPASVRLTNCITVARGRVSLCAEFNFFTDPEAACILLDQLQTTTIIPYELNPALPWVHINV